MRGKSTLPMDEVDTHLLSDILEHFLGEGRESADLIRDERETVADGFNPSFQNDDADQIISDLTRVVQRASEDLLVEECTEYEPDSEVEADFLELTVKGYVEMKRDYFEECHDPYR